MKDLNLEEYIYIKFRPVEDYFALKVNDNDMNYAGISEKSVIICKKQSYADNNDIIVILFNGNYLIRRYKLKDGYEYLVSECINFDTILITESDDFLILGRVVEVRTEIKK